MVVLVMLSPGERLQLVGVAHYPQKHLHPGLRAASRVAGEKQHQLAASRQAGVASVCLADHCEPADATTVAATQVPAAYVWGRGMAVEAP